MERMDLTPTEPALVGQPGDLVDEERVPARPKSSTVMFSLRVDRKTFEALGGIAEERGRRFSDVARDALHAYVDGPSDSESYRLLEAIAAKVGVKRANAEASNVDETRRRRDRGGKSIRKPMPGATPTP